MGTIDHKLPVAHDRQSSLQSSYTPTIEVGNDTVYRIEEVEKLPSPKHYILGKEVISILGQCQT
jgi:hypothetical protein